MATGNRALSLLLVLSGVAANRANASGLEKVSAGLSRLWAQVPDVLQRQQVVVPRAIPEAAAADGPSLDISRLDDPVQLERRLRSLLQGDLETIRLTVPGGKARLGDFTVGSAETFSGNLLVLRGDVDLFGRVSGTWVLDCDVSSTRRPVTGARSDWRRIRDGA